MAKIKIKVIQEVEVKTLAIDAGVRYWEDATVNGTIDSDGELMPFIKDDRWQPEIDIDAGVILNWPKGTTASIHYKVCDDGVYKLKDVNGKVIAEKEGYVPDFLAIDDGGYGDYIILTVNEDGVIPGFEFDHEAILPREEEF